MPRCIPRRTLAVLVAASATFAVAACSDDTPGASTGAPATTVAETTAAPATTASPATTVSQVPPVIVEVSSADGTTVEATVGDTVDLVVDTDVTEWSGEVADPGIATFVPGRDDGSATFNPALEAVAAGETEVTLTDAVSDDSVTFTLSISEA